MKNEKNVKELRLQLDEIADSLLDGTMQVNTAKTMANICRTKIHAATSQQIYNDSHGYVKKIAFFEVPSEE